MRHSLAAVGGQVSALAAQLANLNPEAVLDRGYSIVSKADGSIVRDANQLALDESVGLRFARGGATAKIAGKENKA